MSAGRASVLAIERVEVDEGRLEALVRVRDAADLRTSAVPELPARSVELLPGLERHHCDNDAGARFVEELRDTETPHLLEHVTVELMALAGSSRSLRARTAWDFDRDGSGVFRVHIHFDDDLVALGALREASGIVDWLWGRAERPDIEAAAARLAALRASV